MPCQKREKEFNLYLDGKLHEKDLRSFEAHLELCNICRQDLKLLKKIKITLKGEKPLLKKSSEGILEHIQKATGDTLITISKKSLKELTLNISRQYIEQKFPTQLHRFETEFEANYLRASNFAKNRIPKLEEDIPLEAAAFADSTKAKSFYYEIVVVAYRLIQSYKISSAKMSKEAKDLIKFDYPEETVNFILARLKEL